MLLIPLAQVLTVPNNTANPHYINVTKMADLEKDFADLTKTKQNQGLEKGIQNAEVQSIQGESVELAEVL